MGSSEAAFQTTTIHPYLQGGLQLLISVIQTNKHPDTSALSHMVNTTITILIGFNSSIQNGKKLQSTHPGC